MNTGDFESNKTTLKIQGGDNKNLSNPSDVEKSNTPTEVKNIENVYLDHIVYNAEGSAFYVDPVNGRKYKWLSEKNTWVSAESSEDELKAIHENEFYRWCPEKNEWILKAIPSKTKSEETSDESVANLSKNSVDKCSKSVTYSSEDGTYTYVDSDGTIFFWDTEKNAWFPKIDDDFIARYQLCYGNNDESPLTETFHVINKSSADKSNGSSCVLANSTSRTINTFKKKLTEPPKWFDIPEEQNTKVYVDNLPPDITEDEFVEVMSKCGMIMRDPNTRKYKVKIYTEKNGQPKGDGLCDYIKQLVKHQLLLRVLIWWIIKSTKCFLRKGSKDDRGMSDDTSTMCRTKCLLRR